MSLDKAAVVKQLHVVLREAVEGPSGPWTHFIDNKPGAGLFGALEDLPAAEASRLVGGSSIAAHVHHLVFGMDVSTAALGGDNGPRDWKQSWTVSEVDEQAWQILRGRLTHEYDRLFHAIGKHAGGGEEALGAAVGVIAHVAYHLGAVKQKLAGLRNG